jgi:hypothetical protein
VGNPAVDGVDGRERFHMRMPQIDPESRLNSDVSLGSRSADTLDGAAEFDVAVAYEKLTGVAVLDRAELPQRSRFVIGTGFDLTEPEAVEAPAEKDAEVRIVIGSHRSGMGSSAFNRGCRINPTWSAVAVGISNDGSV